MKYAYITSVTHTHNQFSISSAQQIRNWIFKQFCNWMIIKQPLLKFLFPKMYIFFWNPPNDSTNIAKIPFSDSEVIAETFQILAKSFICKSIEKNWRFFFQSKLVIEQTMIRFFISNTNWLLVRTRCSYVIQAHNSVRLN